MASWLPQFLQRLVGKDDSPVKDPHRSDHLFEHAEESRQRHLFKETYVPPSVEKPQASVHSLGLKDVQRTQVPHTQLVSSSPFPSLEKSDTPNWTFIGKNFQSSSSAQTNIPFLFKNVKGTAIPSGSPSSPAVPRPATQRLVLNDLGKKHQSLVASTPCLIPEPDTEKLIHVDSRKNHHSSSSAQTPSLPLGSPSPSSPPIVPNADTMKGTSLESKCNKEPLVSSPSTLDRPNLQSSSSSQTNIPFLSKNVKGIAIPSGSPSSLAVPRPATQRLVLNDLAKKHQSLVACTPCLIPEPDTEKLIHVDSRENHHSNSSSQTPSLPLGSPSPSSPPMVPKADTTKVTSLETKCNKEPLVSSPSTLNRPKISITDSKKNVWKQKKSHKIPNIDPASPSTRAESSGSAPVLKLTVTVPVFQIPKKFKRELEYGKVPEVLLKALSQSTYCDYFAALMYAEDYYCKHQKWSKYTLPAVTLEVRKGSTPYKNKKGNKRSYVLIEMDSVPDRRPFLLSRDFVHLKPLDKHEKHVKPFKGTVSHVLKKSVVYAEFGDDFISQHTSTCRYDVSFSFNRICMKRCHLSIRAATDRCFHNLLFPDISQRILDINDDKEPLAFNDGNLTVKEKAAVHHILSLWCPPPYLLVGPLSVNVKDELSVTGRVIREAILQIYRANPESRILLASPRNNTCDLLMESLKHDIPEPEMFRVKAAFRGVEEVPENVLDESSYDYGGECFTMSTLTVLHKFRIISTTFMSSFRLYSKGITPGHFSHVFLVDATSAIEPEVLVTLVNLVDDMTAVVVSGSRGDCPNQIRSEISQQYGLRKSYMQRLLESNLYSGSDPLFVSHL